MTVLFKLKKAWAWLVAHWQVPVLIAWSVVVWVFARRDYNAALKVIEARKESYEGRISIIKDSHNREILKRDKLLKEFNATLTQLEREFEKKEKVLEEKHVRTVREVVVSSKNNPEEVRKRIESEFGFTYVE
jgi:hypothetical protein